MHFLSCFSALLAWELLKIEVLMIELSVRYQFSLGGTQVQMTTTQKKATGIPHLCFRVFGLKSLQIQRQSYHVFKFLMAPEDVLFSSWHFLKRKRCRQKFGAADPEMLP